MKVVFFGGTFDPPHLGHQAICLWLSRFSGATHLLISPSKNPLKSVSQTAIEERKQLVNIFIDTLQELEPTAVIKSYFDEIDTTSPITYTIDSLHSIKKQYPNADLALAIGADQYLSFNKWKAYQDILEMASLYVFGRSGYKTPTTPLYNDFATTFIPLNIDISSQFIREQLSCSSEEGSIKDLLPQSIWDYVLEKRLYS